MKYKIYLTDNFYKEARQLLKKYPNIKQDFLKLKDKLKHDPITGNDPYGMDCYKVRMPISDKNQGESGGARIIIQVKVIDRVVYLISVFDKSEQSTIKSHYLEKLLRLIGLRK